MSNFFIEKRQVTIVKLLKTRWANKLKNLLNQESIIFSRGGVVFKLGSYFFKIRFRLRFITFLMGRGSIQEWGCICTHTVSKITIKHKNFGAECKTRFSASNSSFGFKAKMS